MTGAVAISFISQLVAFSVILQSLELLCISREFKEDGLYPWSILRLEYPRGIREFFSPFFSHPSFIFLIVVQLILSLWLFFQPAFFVCSSLFFTALFINIRFRGTFNGGSDKITMISLLALSIATWNPLSNFLMVIGLGFLAFHSVTSYVFAGFAKLKEPSWRKGTVLSDLLRLPHYPVPNKIRQWVILRPGLLRVLTLFILGFECLFPLIFYHQTLAFIFLSMAFTFHILNVWLFGLNRFLFAWIATYPAILFFIQK